MVGEDDRCIGKPRPWRLRLVACLDLSRTELQTKGAASPP